MHLKIKVDWIIPGFVGGMGLYRDSQGYIPISFNFLTKEIESTYLFYGEDALPSEKNPFQTKVFLTHLGEFVTQSGVIIDVENSRAEIRQFLGMDSATPFLVGEVLIIKLNEEMPLALTSKASIAQVDAPIPAAEPTAQRHAEHPTSVADQMQGIAARLMLALLEGEVKRSIYDLYFVPMPVREIEKREFAYCQLQDLYVRSQNAAQPKMQRIAIEWLKKIEAMEDKPVESLMRELEEEIKADLRSQYELEVEKEQQLRSQRVRDGLTEGLKKIPKKERRRDHGKRPEVAPPATVVDHRVEEAFQKFKVQGRIKYRNMLKVARQAMKEYPEVFEAAHGNQRGSHHVLHLEAGPATLVQPHGKKDSAVPKRYANQFLDDLMQRVKSALQINK